MSTASPDLPGIAADRLEALYESAARTVRDRPGCAAQVALARNGRLVGLRSFGSARFAGRERAAGDDSLFALFSVTKALTAAAAWLMLQDGKLALEEPVADRIPEFARHGKQAVTLEHLLTHTAGLPRAPFEATDWPDPSRRIERMASWRLEWEPGSRFVYHGVSAMWVVAELIGRASGADYRTLIRERILAPLGLGNLFVGLPEAEQGRVAEVVTVGEPMTADERTVSPVDAPVIRDDMLQHVNRPENRAIGGPHGGGIGSAADVALFFQGLLADARGDGPGIWQPAMLERAWTPRRVELIDPMTKQPALRGLGVVVAGSEGKMWRGFPENVSARSFGHLGAGGQVAWADPESGLSFAYCTNGAQQNAARQGAIGFRLSTRAAACLEAAGG